MFDPVTCPERAEALTPESSSERLPLDLLSPASLLPRRASVLSARRTICFDSHGGSALLVPGIALIRRRRRASHPGKYHAFSEATRCLAAGTDRGCDRRR